MLLRAFAALAIVFASTAGCQRQAAPGTGVEQPRSASRSTREHGELNPRLLRRFLPVARFSEAHRVPSQGLVDLGRMLWFDTRLSRDRSISCNSCHDLEQYGVDGRATSVGVGGQQGRRNAPTVYNAGQHFALFWDGRAPSLESQATGPILNAREMGLDADDAVRRIRAVPEYSARFRAVFSDAAEPVSLEHIGEAIAAFERGLVTSSRWDTFLAGDRRALTPHETAGLRTFLEVGCVGCHTGPQVGASMYQVAGVVEPWPRTDDLGRFEITQTQSDRMVFKVPTLRNIARTAPYFHDGSGVDLASAVRRMGRLQLGIVLAPDEVDSIVAFLGAMTGDLPRTYIARPPLPRDESTRVADATDARGDRGGQP